MHVNLDNKECDESIKKVGLKFFREFTSTSVQGVKLTDRTLLMKRKSDGVGSKVAVNRIIELPLDLMKFDKDSTL